jgi:hypothetical protein
MALAKAPVRGVATRYRILRQRLHIRPVGRDLPTRHGIPLARP